MMKNKKKNVFIILLLIIVVLPILLSFVKCDNGNSEIDPSTTIQAELKSPRRLNRARAYIGTTVPDSGYIEQLYFNSSLSIIETSNILDRLTTYKIFDDGDNITDYIALVSQDQTSAIRIRRWAHDSGPNGYQIAAIVNNVPHIIFANYSSESVTPGWQENEIFFGIENYLSVLATAMNFEIQNEKISELISTTPFIEIDNRTELQIIFEEIGSGLSGLATFFVGLFNSIVPVFWVNNQPTIITILVLAGVVLTIGFWGIDKLLKLFKIGIGGKK